MLESVFPWHVIGLLADEIRQKGPKVSLLQISVVFGLSMGKAS